MTPSWRSSTSTTVASSEAPREITNVSAIRTVAIRASSSTADTLERSDANAGDLPPRARPAAPSHGLADPGRWARERARERDRLPVRGHLPAQRARDLVRAGGLRARDRRCGGAARRPARGHARRPRRRPQHARLRPAPAAGRVLALPADPRGLARLRAVRARRRRHGVLLARAVDAARAA